MENIQVKKQNQHSVYDTFSLAQDSYPSAMICLQDFLSLMDISETCNKSFFQVLLMSLGFQFLTCFGKEFHRATTSWWRNTTQL